MLINVTDLRLITPAYSKLANDVGCDFRGFLQGGTANGSSWKKKRVLHY